jgi:hypothetical protein
MESSKTHVAKNMTKCFLPTQDRHSKVERLKEGELV